MCNKLNEERRRASRGLHLTPSRTRVLALGLVLAAAGWLPPLALAQVEIDVLGGNGLEASMSSSLLSGFKEVTESLQSLKEPTAFPDSSAMVGRIFQIKLPNKVENSFTGEIVQITEMGKNSLPAWLHWDSESRILQGLPLEKDKGIHYISVSISNQTKATSTEVFSIEVHPEDHLDADSAQMVSNQASAEDDLQPFMCEAEEPVTVLTVILDADLTKMSSEQRVELMDKMRSFSGVGLHHMRMLPVVNNRLFDMSAFMAGPGNAKKVVENGALLSWKLGCSLDQSTVPNLDSVQGPAKEGTMSTKLGYPVVGWHIANKKPGVPKRVRRQLNNTPTPILAVVPPATAVEPPVRVVPTLSSPSIAAPTESFAPPIRGPVPLPGKPTPRVHEPTLHTPTMDPPLPTKVMETTSTIQPTGTRPIYVEATATPTPSTKKPPRKQKKPKSTPVPKVPSKSSTTKPPRRTTPPPSISSDPSNEPPVLRNAIDRVYALVGTYFEVKIPSDTFFDIEDGTTDKLRLTLKQNHDKVVEDGSWIQFNTTSQLLYGLPDLEQVGEHVYYLHATDKGGRFTVDAFEVYVSNWPQNKIPVIFKARFVGEPRSLKNDIHKKILLVKKLAYALGDRNSSTVSLTKIEKGSILVEWTNTSLQQKPCPKEQLAIMSRALADASGNPSQAFRYTMEPEFRTINVTVKGTGSCAKYSFIPPEEYDPMPSITRAPDLGSSRGSTDDVYLHTVIPAVVVAAILLIAGVIAMICYRKKRKGKLTIEDQATFIKKGVPIIFADELDDSKPPPSSSMPLILQEEKPPLPPPEYPNMATPETTPLNQELLGEYTALKDEDPNAPPYQPPPPFATPMEGKGSRPKNMTPYRSPPPYVPP